MFSVSAGGALRRWPAGQALLVPGAYVTDGRTLYRVISQFAPEADRVFASLEDCVTLEARAYSPEELHEMGLRPVRPTAGVAN
jgi:hypothetical protein